MTLYRLSKVATGMSAEERRHYREGELGPGVAERRTSSLPKIKQPQVWEMSAHPHKAERAGEHIDLRLGDPQSGVAHSFVLPKARVPGPGEMVQVVPTFDHTLPYMDYTGPISTEYGKGVVEKGRRTEAEVYHSEPGDEPGTKVRFNLYDGPAPEEYSIRKDQKGKWFLHNKTLTRLRRPDLPSFKPEYGEIALDEIDPSDSRQAMMPKLDGAHAVIDLKAGRSPRVFSYRVGKKSGTGLIEHTHKMPELLKDKVPKELDGTMLRGEILGVTPQGTSIPAERIGGLLNSKVWESRLGQESLGVRLQAFPFSVIKYKGKTMEDAPFEEKLKVLREVESKLKDLVVPEIATTAEEKIGLLNAIADKAHPLTEEGVVLVNRNEPGRPIKAKHAPDFDVFVRDVLPAKKKGGGFHERAGAISYSWTPEGAIVGQLGGFKHDEATDMLTNPDQYIGRVAKVKATKMFKDKDGNPGALFQPRFKEWHLDKGEIEKSSSVGRAAAIGAGAGGLLGGTLGFARPFTQKSKKDPTTHDRAASAIVAGLGGAALGGGIGAGVGALRKWDKAPRFASRAEESAHDFGGGGFGDDFWERFHQRQRQREQAWDDFFRDFHERARAAGAGGGRRAGAGGGGGGFGFRARAERPSWVPSGVKTKQEAKNIYRREAMKHHPDRGGRESQMKRVNAEWEAWEKSPEFEKLSFIRRELEKIAATRSLVKDFLAGVDPTGTSTFQYGMQDATKSKSEAALRRGIGTVGGIIGGATIVPAVISGIIEGAKGFGSGGLKGGVVGAAKGTYKPYVQLYRAAVGAKSVAKLEQGKGLTDFEVKNLVELAKEVDPSVGKYVKAMSEGAKKISDVPVDVMRAVGAEDALAKVRTALSSRAIEAGSALALSGVIGGGSAYLQYGKGRETGKLLSPEGRKELK